MLERISHLAEQAATRASRRAFLGRLGSGAMGVAVAAAATLVLPGTLQAGRRACGTDSVFACIGMEVGSPCPLGGGDIGKCSRVQGSSGCLCVKHPPEKDH